MPFLYPLFLQIISSIEEIYFVVFPDIVSEIALALQRLINVELVTLGVPFECIGISTFHSKLKLYILTPVLLVCAIFAVSAARRALTRQHVCPQFLLDGLPLALLVAFLSLPSVTSLAARAFLIECFDSGDCYMRADLSVRAGAADPRHGGLDGSQPPTPEWAQIRRTAWVGLALYPLGQFIFFALLLMQVQRSLKSSRSAMQLTRAASFLYVEFTPRCRAFELLHMLQKICLVGIATTFVPTGSMVQLLFGIVITLSHLTATAYMQPYTKRASNTMAIGCSLSLACIFLACVPIKIQIVLSGEADTISPMLAPLISVPPTYVRNSLIFSTFGAFGLAAVLLLVELSGQQSHSNHIAIT
jgi:hypothetical protein